MMKLRLNPTLLALGLCFGMMGFCQGRMFGLKKPPPAKQQQQAKKTEFSLFRPASWFPKKPSEAQARRLETEQRQRAELEAIRATALKEVPHTAASRPRQTNQPSQERAPRPPVPRHKPLPPKLPGTRSTAATEETAARPQKSLQEMLAERAAKTGLGDIGAVTLRRAPTDQTPRTSTMPALPPPPLSIRPPTNFMQAALDRKFALATPKKVKVPKTQAEIDAKAERKRLENDWLDDIPVHSVRPTVRSAPASIRSTPGARESIATAPPVRAIQTTTPARTAVRSAPATGGMSMLDEMKLKQEARAAGSSGALTSTRRELSSEELQTKRAAAEERMKVRKATEAKIKTERLAAANTPEALAKEAKAKAAREELNAEAKRSTAEAAREYKRPSMAEARAALAGTIGARSAIPKRVPKSVAEAVPAAPTASDSPTAPRGPRVAPQLGADGRPMGAPTAPRTGTPPRPGSGGQVPRPPKPPTAPTASKTAAVEDDAVAMADARQDAKAARAKAMEEMLAKRAARAAATDA